MTDGPSFVTETIYPARFRHVEELKNMGASIEADTSTGTATIKPSKLQGAKVYASDLRRSLLDYCWITSRRCYNNL